MCPEGNSPNCWHLLTCLNKLFMRSVIQNEGHWISTSFSTLNISTAAFLVRVSAWTWSQSGWILAWKIIKSDQCQTPRLVQDNEPRYLVVLKNRCALGGKKKLFIGFTDVAVCHTFICEQACTLGGEWSTLFYSNSAPSAKINEEFKCQTKAWMSE